MARIALCNSVLEPGDAVTNDVLGMLQVLSGQGHRCALFADKADKAEAKADKAADKADKKADKADKKAGKK